MPPNRASPSCPAVPSRLLGRRRPVHTPIVLVHLDRIWMAVGRRISMGFFLASPSAPNPLDIPHQQDSFVVGDRVGELRVRAHTPVPAAPNTFYFSVTRLAPLDVLGLTEYTAVYLLCVPISLLLRRLLRHNICITSFGRILSRRILSRRNVLPAASLAPVTSDHITPRSLSLAPKRGSRVEKLSPVGAFKIYI